MDHRTQCNRMWRILGIPIGHHSLRSSRFLDSEYHESYLPGMLLQRKKERKKERTREQPLAPHRRIKKLAPRRRTNSLSQRSMVARIKKPSS